MVLLSFEKKKVMLPHPVHVILHILLLLVYDIKYNPVMDSVDKNNARISLSLSLSLFFIVQTGCRQNY